MYQQPSYISEKLRKFLHAMAAEEGGIRDRMAVAMREIYSLHESDFPNNQRERFLFLQEVSRHCQTKSIKDLKMAIDYAFCLQGDVSDVLAESRFRSE